MGKEELVKKIDSSEQIKIIESIERLAKDCGYTWYKGQHPDEQISTLLTAFTDLKMLKRALPVPSTLKRDMQASLEKEKPGSL